MNLKIVLLLAVCIFSWVRPTLAHEGSGFESVLAQGAEFQKSMTSIASFFKLNTPIDLMQPEEGSILLANPELKLILNDLGRLLLPQPTFRARLTTFAGGELSKKVLSDFVEKQRTGFDQLVQFLADELESKGHLKVAEGVRHQADEQHRHLVQYLESFKRLSRSSLIDLGYQSESQRIYDLVGITFDLLSYQTGLRGEIFAMLSLPNITGIGVKLSETRIYRETILKRLEFLESAVKERPLNWVALSKKYPLVFKNALMRKKNPQTVNARFDLIRQWIGDKEVDLIQMLNGREIWIEVKRTINAMTVDQFEQSHGAKSNSQQMNEMLQILELSGETGGLLPVLEFLSTAGVSPGLKALLQSLKVSVHSVQGPGVECSSLLH